MPPKTKRNARKTSEQKPRKPPEKPEKLRSKSRPKPEKAQGDPAARKRNQPTRQKAPKNPKKIPESRASAKRSKPAKVTKADRMFGENPEVDKTLGKPKRTRPKPEAKEDIDDGADMTDPDKVFSDSEDNELDDSIGVSNWANSMIVKSVHDLLERQPRKQLQTLAKEFCLWVEKFVTKPPRPNAYKRWGSTMKRAFSFYDNRQHDQAVSFIDTWIKRQAKALAATRLYEPAQAERFLVRDIMELWFHWLRSSKLVRKEAALYSAITFFTGARAIEVSKLHIEDLYFEQNGNALICPVRESKTNVFKDIPERLVLCFRPDCPIDLRDLFYRIKGDRTHGRLFQACKNRRTLCYHYGRGAMELGWTRIPSGHSGRTTAITMGIAAGIPREDLEIMFRWASGSDMYRRYRSVNMEASTAGAPALVARALVDSLSKGPLGTPAPVERLELKDENVDLGWYKRAVQAIRGEGDIPTGLKDARQAVPTSPKKETFKTEPSTSEIMSIPIDLPSPLRLTETERPTPMERVSIKLEPAKAGPLVRMDSNLSMRKRARARHRPKPEPVKLEPPPMSVVRKLQFLLGEDLRSKEKGEKLF